MNEVIDEHLSVKERQPKVNKPPFLNSALRKAIYKKMLFNKYRKFRSTENWEAYRRQRHAVVKSGDSLSVTTF